MATLFPDLNSNEGQLNVNGNNWNDNNGNFFEIALLQRLFIQMKTHKNIYSQIYSKKNLVLAWKKARKGKTQKEYVIEFEDKLIKNINDLHRELKEELYFPMNLESFILRDPKTRRISKSQFRDRIVHHALCNIIEPIFDKTFIYDNCANRKGKGNLFAIKRFEKFVKKVSRNGKQNGWFNKNQVKGYCLKADIKHYFREIDHKILFDILERKVKDSQVMQLIKTIVERERDAVF